MPKTTFTTLLFLFLVSTLTAQVKVGFQYLQTGQLELARTAFENQTGAAKYAAAAHYGLACIYAESDARIQTSLEAYRNMEKAQDLSLSLSPGKKRKWIKQGWLPADNMRGLDKTIQDSLLVCLSRTDQLAEIDSVLVFLEARKSRKLKAKSKEELEKARLRNVSWALRSANDYHTLHSLATRHRQTIVQNNFLFSSDLDWRMINAFLRDYGEHKLEQFVKENPDHYLSKDCWIPQYITAVKKESVSSLLDFLNDYPHSILDELAMFWIEENGLSEKGRASLNERQLQQLESIEVGNALKFKLVLDAGLDSSFHQDALDYIKNGAPARRTHHLMERVLQKYLKTKQWKLAEDLVVKCQPLFPDVQPTDCRTAYNFYSNKQPWFNTAIPILQRPAEGIELWPVDGLNTEKGDEFSPVISSDGKTIYFAGAGRTDNIKGEDIFVATWQGGRWSQPALVEKLSGEANFVPLSLTADGREMLVFFNGQLHLSQKTVSGWSEPQELTGLTGAFTWIGRAVFADNGRVVIMEASKKLNEIDRASNTDIFVAIKDQYNKWGEPFSIGTMINTQKQERSPFLHADGRSLYFSSDGHDGLGKMDVYMATRLDNTWKNWTEPVNMGKEINSLEDELGYNYAISLSGKIAYLASAEKSTDRYDIYATGLPSFVKPEPFMVITALIEQEGNTPLPVVAKDATGKIVGRAFPTPDGKVEITIPANVQGPVSIESTSKTNVFTPIVVPVDSSTEVVAVERPLKIYNMNELVSGKKSIQSQGILFEKNESRLSNEAVVELKAIYNLLSHLDLFIEIAGFADPDGSDSYNKELSQKRAEVVREKLIEQGYPADRITAEGYGKKTDGARQMSEAEKADCRRVEVRVKGKTARE